MAELTPEQVLYWQNDQVIRQNAQQTVLLQSIRAWLVWIGLAVAVPAVILLVAFLVQVLS